MSEPESKVSLLSGQLLLNQNQNVSSNEKQKLDIEAKNVANQENVGVPNIRENKVEENFVEEVVSSEKSASEIE